MWITQMPAPSRCITTGGLFRDCVLLALLVAFSYIHASAAYAYITEVLAETDVSPFFPATVLSSGLSPPQNIFLSC